MLTSGLRREHRAFHGDDVRMRRDVVTERSISPYVLHTVLKEAIAPWRLTGRICSTSAMPSLESKSTPKWVKRSF